MSQMFFQVASYQSIRVCKQKFFLIYLNQSIWIQSIQPSIKEYYYLTNPAFLFIIPIKKKQCNPLVITKEQHAIIFNC